MSLFTTCIITVSSQAQAVQFEKRIQRRIGHGLYPREISFRVYSDPSDMPAGSGGGTLHALSRFFDESGWKGAPEDFFADRKILLIHAAGKNRGVPSFVPENRLFIPLPLDSSSIFPPVVLDTHLSLFLRYPWRKGEVVVTAGDAVIDFETGLIPEIDRGDMCGFAASGTPVQGSRHGVYKFDHYRRDVVNYYQKADVRELRNDALIEGTGECALDMGILALSPRAAASFVTLGKKWDDSGRIASFDLYLEVITAALYGMTPEEFDRRTAARTGLTAEKRKSIFETFNRFTLRAMLARHASFYHTGTFKGYMETCTRLSAGDIRLFYNDAYDEVRAINSPDRIIFNSIHCDIPIGSRKPLICESVENSTVENPLGSNIFHGLSRFSSDEVFQPGICLEERSVDNLRIRIVYSQADLFNRGERLSDVQFCGLPMDVWLAQHKLRPEDIGGDGSVIDLYTARLFFDCPAVLLPGYWQPQSTEEWTAKFRTARRYSLEELDRLCTLDCKEERRIAIRTLLLREQITGGRGWVSISQPDFKTVFASGTPLEHLTKMCDTTDDVLLRRYRKELLDSVSQGCDIASAPVSVRLSRSEISGLFGCEGKPVKRAIQESERVMIRCPVRMDIAGGWSDTAPYALQYGGAAVNCAIDINGKKPVEVTCRAITEPKIVFRFSSIPEPWVIDSFEDLEKKQEVKAFAFCREMLRISGLAIPHDRPFSEILKQAGGGFEIVTECGIAPDGLGVSSVQMVSVLASCARFYGVTLDNEFTKMLN